MSLRFLRLTSLLGLVLLGLPAAAQEPDDQQLAQALLMATGTASAFALPVVQDALRDPQPFLGTAGAARFDRLLADAGLRRWQPPRVWVLQEKTEGDVRRWENAARLIQSNALARGYDVVTANPLPSAVEAINFLTPGKEHPGLRGLLAAYESDVLVLLRGRQWTLWQAGAASQGELPAMGQEWLADVIAEVLAGRQQWPEAKGRPLVQFGGIAGLAHFAAVQGTLAALPGVQQLQLVRAEKDRLWFAYAAPGAGQMALAMDADPRLSASPLPNGLLLPRVVEACRLACLQQVRQWQPELAKPPAAPALSVQSPPHS